jgi:hypothetical protein
MEHFNIRSLLSARVNQKCFHVAAEEYIRIEFRNMAAGEELEGFRYSGNVVLTAFAGSFALVVDGISTDVVEMDQIVTAPNKTIVVSCSLAGTIQLIWSPPYALIEKIPSSK